MSSSCQAQQGELAVVSLATAFSLSSLGLHLYSHPSVSTGVGSRTPWTPGSADDAQVPYIKWLSAVCLPAREFCLHGYGGLTVLLSSVTSDSPGYHWSFCFSTCKIGTAPPASPASERGNVFRKKGGGGVHTRAPSQGLVSGRPTLRHTYGRDSSRPGSARLPGRGGGQSLVPGVPGPWGGLQPRLPAGHWRGSFTPSSRRLVSGTPSLDTMHYNPGCW